MTRPAWVGTRYDPTIHHRRFIRLRHYDYSQAGAYFVTVCTQDRLCWLGIIRDGEVFRSGSGHVVQAVWQGLPARFPTAELDQFIVMPNHIPGVIIVGAQFIAPSPPEAAPSRPEASDVDHTPVARGEGVINHAPTLGEIVRTLKAASARLIRKDHVSEFAWQRNYYEHIIRDQADLLRIREYIADNPARWERDQLHPDNPSRW